MWNGTLSAVVRTFTSTDCPASTLVRVANPSMPPFEACSAPWVFHAVVPGKQFSTTTALPLAQVAARGVAPATPDTGEGPPALTARTA